MSSDDKNLYLGCKAYDGMHPVSYGYIPQKSTGIAFCALFGLSMVAHTVQFCWKRTWWCSVFSIGCLGKFPTSSFQFFSLDIGAILIAVSS